MKKGLRLLSPDAECGDGDSNRRPDEEGIKTAHEVRNLEGIHSNRRPDEEGIKTGTPSGSPRAPEFQPQT